MTSVRPQSSIIIGRVKIAVSAFVSIVSLQSTKSKVREIFAWTTIFQKVKKAKFVIRNGWATRRGGILSLAGVWIDLHSYHNLITFLLILYSWKTKFLREKLFIRRLQSTCLGSAGKIIWQNRNFQAFVLKLLKTSLQILDTWFKYGDVILMSELSKVLQLSIFH